VNANIVARLKIGNVIFYLCVFDKIQAVHFLSVRGETRKVMLLPFANHFNYSPF
jgi:hypothetical protein